MSTESDGGRRGSGLGLFWVLALHGGPDGDVTDIGLLRTLLDLERNRRA